jgi:glycosyltransferase involved in cell wall biosynthesis
MHIAIDTTPLSSGHSGRGVGIYTKFLIEALQKYENSHSYSFFTRGQKVNAKADVIHYPYFDPFFLTLPLIKVKPTVVTVHDLIPLVFPAHFPSGIRGLVKWQLQKMSLRNVHRIIADSHSSKNDIARIIGYNTSAIDTIYLAPTIDIKKCEEIKSPEQFVLFVGDVNWNKNIRGLLQAFLIASKAYPKLMLVLVGKAFKDSSLPETNEVDALIAEYNLENRIIKTGWISDGQLATLYSKAMCLVQPSHYEGFGLPVLDAMACGCPVVVSDVSSLIEIAGPSVRVHAGKPEEIAGGIQTIVSLSEEKRKKLISDGRIWVKEFTWKRTANRTVASYGSAVI